MYHLCSAGTMRKMKPDYQKVYIGEKKSNGAVFSSHSVSFDVVVNSDVVVDFDVVVKFGLLPSFILHFYSSSLAKVRPTRDKFLRYNITIDCRGAARREGNGSGESSVFTES